MDNRPTPDSGVFCARDHSTRLSTPRTMGENVNSSHVENGDATNGGATFTETNSNIHHNNNYEAKLQNNEVIEEHDLPSEITFEKRSIPKSRTQSIQSVLSSVSLRNFIQQHQQNNSQQQSQKQNKAFVPHQPHQQSKHLNASSYIQAPATAGSSKRRASFEIGQRLPFNKDADVESDGELEVNEEQKKLTEDALRRLSSFSKFQPAEVDFKKPATTVTSSIPKSLSGAAISNSFNGAPSSLTRKPQINQSSASQLREEAPKYNPISSSTASTPPFPHPQQHRTSSFPSAQPMSKTTSTSSKFDDTSSLRTINDPKRPMYIPAVLRQSNTNLKPEDLRFINEQKNSNKFKATNKNLLNNAANSIKHQNWKFNLDGSSNQTTTNSTIRQPTRAHWKKDLSRSSCAYCSKNFTFFERRHHCRRCGDIFCNEHVSNYLNLGPDANFCVDSPNGVLCKVCDSCFKDYEVYLKKKFGTDVINDVVKSNNNNNNNNATNGVAVNDLKKKASLEQQNLNVGSIPADWSWSSF